MNDSRRLRELLQAHAEQAVPEELDLWPAVRARLRAGRTPSRWRGALTLAAAMLAVALGGALLLAPMLNGAPGPYAAGFQAATPTPPGQPSPSPTATPVEPPGEGPSPIVLRRDAGYTLPFQAQAGEWLRLRVEVVQAGEAAPDLVVSLEGIGDDDDVNLLSFNPARVSEVAVDFSPARAGRLLLALRLAGEETAGEDAVQVFVSLEQPPTVSLPPTVVAPVLPTPTPVGATEVAPWPATPAAGEGEAVPLTPTPVIGWATEVSPWLTPGPGALMPTSIIVTATPIGPLTIAPWPATPTSIPGPGEGVALPPGTVAVSVAPQAMPPGLAEGDRVDVILSLLFVEVDETFQAPVPSPVTAPPPDASAVTASPPSEHPPRIIQQYVVRDALVVQVGPSSAVTLAVSPQDAAMLTWAADARQVIILVPAGSTEGLGRAYFPQ